jgi:peptidyl-prolyl cis-trans isomerase C
LKQFIEDEMLVREAIKAGLADLPTLRKDLEIWKEYYLSEVLMQKLTTNINISEGDIAAYREETGRSGSEVLQVNITEILTDDLDNVGIIFDFIKEGKDFSELAKEFNQREWTKESNGEWGYFSVSAGGEIGRITAGMNIGEVYGPLKVPEGYSIFKVTDKRYIRTGIKDTVDSRVINMQLSLGKLNKTINDRTVQLAEKYGITINNELLQRTELSDVNTFTYRLIGFGGKIAALPITIPLYEWYRTYQSEKDLP